jgi:hypothetical protein
MPKKQQEGKLSKNDLRVIDPLIVAGKDIEKIIVGYSSKTAANDRSRKVGPKYFMRGGRPYYLVRDLLEHFTQNPVETANDERR